MDIGGLSRQLLGGWGMMFLGDIAGRSAAGLGWGQQAATAHNNRCSKLDMLLRVNSEKLQQIYRIN